MYAIVANGMCAVCKNKEQLDVLAAIYPYPKFALVSSVEEGRDWIRHHNRKRNNYEFDHYGNTFSSGYVDVKYSITENGIEYYIDTTSCGYIKLQDNKDAAVEFGYEHMRVLVTNTKLKDDLILHHVIAIRRILFILGPIVDVNVQIPDVSIYLALMKYTGSNFTIKAAQREINNRIGGFSISIKMEEDTNGEY